MMNMTNEELKKIVSDIQKMVDEKMKDAFINGNFPTYVSKTQSSWGNSTASYSRISPTDVEARGLFSYQEPEQDEQGTFYGYKVLHRHCRSCCELSSPRFYSEWHHGELHSDRVPSGRSMHGIHFTKCPDHPELRQYIEYSYLYSYSVIVKCALSGTIVETEQGFRAEHAQIIGVLEDGNWKSYQDYQERSRTYSDRNRQEEWEEEWRFSFGNTSKGIWNAYYNPSADS